MNVIKSNSHCQRLLEEMTPTINRHAEFISASSRYDNNKTLKQVQGDDRMGFTLIELLVVVLIIGVLAAVALPQYQKAVTKSRYASIMPSAKAIADGNEMYYLTHGQYAPSVGDLDVKVTNAEGDMSVNVVGNATDDYTYTIATRPDINNNYIIYQKHSKNYPGEIHCEAENENARAAWICETAYHGTKIEDNTLNSGYTLYVLEGDGVKTTTTTPTGTDTTDEEDPTPSVSEGPKWNGTDMLQSTYDLMYVFYQHMNGGDNFEDDNISVASGRLEYIDANTLKIKGELYTYDPVFNSITGPFVNHLRRIWYKEGTNDSIGDASSYDQGQTWEHCSGTCQF